MLGGGPFSERKAKPAVSPLFPNVFEKQMIAPMVPLAGASQFQKAQFIDSIWLFDFAAEHYWVQNQTGSNSCVRIGPQGRFI
ncbi:MAG TPA: hypothetical protein VKF83_07495, partial [Stellaceae bacterium]|nr:hypothetical protein [Stellaceae bacterium]